MHEPSYKFDDFELDPAKFELKRAGQPLKLERIPLELLILLIEKEGNVVSRQEIVERLWGKNVFVDTEHGVNVAIRKIRAALKDDAESPRFIQTVLGKGYRFVGTTHSPSISHEPSPVVPESIPVAPAPLETVIETQKPKVRWHRWQTVIAGILVIAAAALGLNAVGIRDRIFRGNRSTQIRSIAVIPLANLSGDPSQDYFADGMTDEIITMLAKNSSLRVVSRTSAMQYKAAKRPVRDIARELGVDGILEGSVERTADKVHMTVQLIHGASDSHIWAESYDRDFKDAFSIPAEVSQTIAKRINVTTTPIQPARTVNPEAHDAYLRGRYFWFGPNLSRSIEQFKKAIQIQPDYALAWGGLADAYVVQAVDNEVPVKEILDRAEDAARRAIELDDSSAEVHKTMAGLNLFGHWDPKKANEESLRSIAMDPNHAETHHLRAYILEALNRPEEALQEQRRCTELDRFERPWALGKVLSMQRKYDEAIREYKLLLDAQPQDAYGWFLLSDIYHFKGMGAEAAAARAQGLRRQGLEKEAQTVERTFRSGGEKAVQQSVFTRMKEHARKEFVSPLDLAFSAARSGNREEALKYLEAAYEERTPWLVLIQWEPDFDAYHSEPRYREVVKKIGLEPAY